MSKTSNIDEMDTDVLSKAQSHRHRRRGEGGRHCFGSVHLDASCTVFVMTPPNEHTSEGGRDDRGVPYHAESTLSSAQVLKCSKVRTFQEEDCYQVCWTADIHATLLLAT